jgi:hypothetical protein
LSHRRKFRSQRGILVHQLLRAHVERLDRAQRNPVAIERADRANVLADETGNAPCAITFGACLQRATSSRPTTTLAPGDSSIE